MLVDKFLNLEGPAPPLGKAASYSKSASKKSLDFLAAILGSAVLFPFLLLIAAAIKLDSKGSVLFRQKRVGRDGKIFNILKFRTMISNADNTIHEHHIHSYAMGLLDGTDGYKYKDDPRITRVGKFLRNTSIDELPQLWNVIRGEMSIVGPRPVPVYEADFHNLWQNERLEVLPGITGLWQVLGRSSVSMDDQIRLDIRYIRHQSFWLDIKIILATILCALSARGAG